MWVLTTGSLASQRTTRWGCSRTSVCRYTAMDRSTERSSSPHRAAGVHRRGDRTGSGRRPSRRNSAVTKAERKGHLSGEPASQSVSTPELLLIPHRPRLHGDCIDTTGACVHPIDTESDRSHGATERIPASGRPSRLANPQTRYQNFDKKGRKRGGGPRRSFETKGPCVRHMRGLPDRDSERVGGAGGRWPGRASGLSRVSLPPPKLVAPARSS